MKLVSGTEMRRIDERTIHEHGIPGERLMERAGTGVAAAVSRIARLAGYANPRAVLFAGKGNNGGDVFVTGRVLKEAGFAVDVRLVGAPADVRGDALTHLEKMRRAGVKLRPWVAADSDNTPSAPSGTIVVDGLLGTGISGPAREPAASAIREINLLGHTHPVVAVDVPSGLNADTGEAAGPTVRADVTATMGLPKTGLVAAGALEYVGTVEVVDIGIPESVLASVESTLEMIARNDVRALIPRRPRAGHKGTFGHVLVIGAAPGFSGAVAMAAEAALRSGAGLVSALVPASVAPIVAGLVGEAMVHGGAESETGSLSADVLRSWGRDVASFDAVLVGPGMTACAATRTVVETLLDTLTVPLVADADALNVFSGEAGALHEAAGRLVVTPHPGEMARLLGCAVADVQAQRAPMAAEAARKTGGVVVLKGAGTVVADRTGTRTAVNMTGNPGMATGGMGDVLGGLLAGFCAQGVSLYDAARVAAYVHGHAGDSVAWRTSQAGMIARDLLFEIPKTLREVCVR